jgi:hypothetical protein
MTEIKKRDKFVSDWTNEVHRKVRNPVLLELLRCSKRHVKDMILDYNSIIDDTYEEKLSEIEEYIEKIEDFLDYFNYLDQRVYPELQKKILEADTLKDMLNKTIQKVFYCNWIRQNSEKFKEQYNGQEFDDFDKLMKGLTGNITDV